jgi:hypothetical protein
VTQSTSDDSQKPDRQDKLSSTAPYVLQSTEEARRWRTLAHAEAIAGIELPPVHGLPLSSRDFRLHDDQIIAELAEPFLVGGEMFPAGTSVVLDLPSGDVVPRR